MLDLNLNLNLGGPKSFREGNENRLRVRTRLRLRRGKDSNPSQVVCRSSLIWTTSPSKSPRFHLETQLIFAYRSRAGPCQSRSLWQSGCNEPGDSLWSAPHSGAFKPEAPVGGRCRCYLEPLKKAVECTALQTLREGPRRLSHNMSR